MGGLTSAATTGIFSGIGSTLSNAAGKTVASAGEQAATQAAQAAAEPAAWGAFGDLGSTFAVNPATGMPTLGAQLASANEIALQSSLSTFGTGVGGNIASVPQPLMMADPNLVINTDTGPSFGAELANVAGIPDAVNAGITPAQAGVEGFNRSGEFFAKPAGIKLDKAIEPSWFQRNVLGETTSYAKGDVVPFSEFKGKGIFGGDISYQDMGLEERISANITNPASYAPIATAALTGAFDEPYEYEEPAARPEPETGFGSKTLTGGDVRRPVATEEELRKMALEGGRRNYFTPYRYAAEGGLIGLQQGGMPTPQAPSSMAGMLAQPQPQQPLPINVQVQPQQPVMPQQPQPSMPMPPQQMGSGVTPLPDQQKEFMKLMDMEDQVQSQKRSQSTQALANLMGLGMNFVGSQYPQTSPSGQAVQPPPTPPMNYGSQVNLGLAGGGQPYFEGQVQGPGDGQSDEVAFRVDGGQVDGAMLSPDEYVLAANVVSAIGNGSSDAGAAKLDQFMKGVRQDAYGTTKQMQPFNNQGLTNLVA